jgi:hypothetical protein
MALVNGYTTKDRMRTYLGLGPGETGDDTLLEDFIEQVSRAIDHWTRREFYATSETREFDAVGDHIIGRLLMLDQDLLSITTLTNGNGSTIASTEYVLRPANKFPKWGVELKSGSSATWTYSGSYQEAISIEGSWGYTAGTPGDNTFPNDIELACQRWTYLVYQQKETPSPMDAVGIAISPETGIPLIPAGIPRDVAELLRPYRRNIP